MDILFIHGNYPAQFRHLSAGFGANSKNRVVFLTEKKHERPHKIHGVELAFYERHRSVNPDTHHYLHATEEAILLGQGVLRSVNVLLADGFNPKLIIFHGGMGLGLFLRDILPNSLAIGYFEWWFNPETTINLVEEFNFNVQLSSGMRNLPTLQELERCDHAVVPTSWQKSQFPKLVQSKIEVIFDGIDTSFFHPPSNGVDERELIIRNRDTKERFCFQPNQILLSYATRGMEPLRGFPEFMRSLPEAFRAEDNLQVIVAGADRCAYSYGAPTHQGSWKKHLIEELKDQVPMERMHFVGLLDYNDYRSLLWRSNLHCYFTREYVTSWSLFEAAYSGARLLTNASKATQGIVQESSCYWTKLEDQKLVSNNITKYLRQSLAMPSNRARPIQGFELEKSLSSWAAAINNLMRSMN